MLKYKTGNAVSAILNNEIDVLVHGCNCFCTQGAGIAKEIRQRIPSAYKVDTLTKKGDRNKLGKISISEFKTNYFVINAYTQYTYWDPNDMLSYNAIESCLHLIKKQFSGKRIGLPKIGCGLAGGDWNIVEKIINDILGDENVTVYII